MINKVTPDEIAGLRAALHGRKQPSVMLEHLIADYEDLMAQPATPREGVAVRRSPITPALRKAIQAAAMECHVSSDLSRYEQIITRHIEAAMKEQNDV